MHQVHIPSARRLIACLLAVMLSACSSSTAPEAAVMPDFEGTYSLTGTYSGRAGQAVFGGLEVTDQNGSTATASITLELRDNGNTFFVLNTPSDVVAATVAPGVAQLANDGAFTLTYSGREEIFGIDPTACCNFTFAFNGKLNGNAISGSWTLTRDMPSSDQGSFTATR